MLSLKQMERILPERTNMEFDEINALINIEREKYQHDLWNGTIQNISQQIKQDKAVIRAQYAERTSFNHVMRCAYEVEMASERLKLAMNSHAMYMKRVMAM